MKYLSLCVAAAMGLAACQDPLADYPNMTDDQKAKFMVDYKKDMDKVYSVANKMGQITTTHIMDPVNDRITVKMKLNQTFQGMNSAMATQVGESMLEQNCKERFMRDFWEAGITYTMEMVDQQGRKIVDMSVSPEKCAAFK